MNLYEVVVFYLVSKSKSTMKYFVIAKDKLKAEQIALEANSEFEYGFTKCESVKLLAENKQCGEPEILLIEGVKLEE